MEDSRGAERTAKQRKKNENGAGERTQWTTDDHERTKKCGSAEVCTPKKAAIVEKKVRTVNSSSKYA